MRIRLLGTGTPNPSLKRMSSGHLVEIGEHTIVFDHGFGAHHRLLEAGLPATRVTHMFFTHLHFDHFGDYGRLVLTRWDQGVGRFPELKVYGPSPLAELSDRLFGESGVYDPDLVGRTSHGASLCLVEARGGKLPRSRPNPQVTELKPGDVVRDGHWSITSAEVSHFQPYLTSYGYRLETPEGTFVYSGDNGKIEPMLDLAKNCDVLVHMCHYIAGMSYNDDYAGACMSHMDLAELAQRAGVRTLVLTHMTEQIDQPGVRERVIADMARVYEGTLIFGEDLLEIPLKPKRIEKNV